MSPRRCPSDLTDAQWELIQPLLPEPNTSGRPEKHPRREIVNAILYVVRSGCPWRYLPRDLPPWQTVYWHFQQWEQAGIITELLSELHIRARLQAAGEDRPSTGVAGPLSVDDAGTTRDDIVKRGRKRLIPEITRPLVALTVMAASWRERDEFEQVLLWAF
ncbi:transposase [Sphaerimonospora cavernae]|uniref:Transposase n=1 Tax=Sphaerimonospora cavernae TaxID=1740611 RepID=A0ABV6U2A9_9ACTN